MDSAELTFAQLVKQRQQMCVIYPINNNTLNFNYILSYLFYDDF